MGVYRCLYLNYKPGGVTLKSLSIHCLPEQHAAHGVYWRRYKSRLHEQDSDRYRLTICHA